MLKTLGGDRLGGGKKQKVELDQYRRSTHDLSHVVRTTMAPGTIVPFLKQLGLPGDTWNIKLHLDVLTMPTIGPLFGTYTVQLDLFIGAIRLYQADLHMNLTEIGLDMSKILLPQVQIRANNAKPTALIDSQQINPSAIWRYLGISGVGVNANPATKVVYRNFNAIPWLMYWETYKQYYANKQEKKGAVIHKDVVPVTVTPLISASGTNMQPNSWPVSGAVSNPISRVNENSYVQIFVTNISLDTDPLQFGYWTGTPGTSAWVPFLPGKTSQGYQTEGRFKNYVIDTQSKSITFYNPTKNLLDIMKKIDNGEPGYAPLTATSIAFVANTGQVATFNQMPIVKTFDLKNIDSMKKKILQAPDNVALVITKAETLTPYTWALQEYIDGSTNSFFSAVSGQEGLGIRTYKSDMFNNWLDTEWISGTTGINNITAVDTTGNKFTIPSLILNKKIYDLLMRVAVSGGTYDDWLEAVYTHDRQKSSESPIYMGGLIQNLVFQEVVGLAATDDQPLGTLAGKGKLGGMKKGGEAKIRVDEPGYIMGMVSIVPNLDYYQGNHWDTNLKTMNDLHKPELDQIGFQDLLTDQMAWWDTVVPLNVDPQFRSAGKQPAWTQYMTEVNKVYGNFAEATQQGFMVLTRNYVPNWVGTTVTIADLTTYVDPVKFNNIFADARLDAQNFWVQIGMEIEVRRIMSAKVMPNL